VRPARGDIEQVAPTVDLVEVDAEGGGSDSQPFGGIGAAEPAGDRVGETERPVRGPARGMADTLRADAGLRYGGWGDADDGPPVRCYSYSYSVDCGIRATRWNG
jgi:hypothetical protein